MNHSSSRLWFVLALLLLLLFNAYAVYAYHRAETGQPDVFDLARGPFAAIGSMLPWYRVGPLPEPSELAQLKAEGRIALDDNRYADARRIFLQAQQLAPQDLEVREALGRIDVYLARRKDDARRARSEERYADALRIYRELERIVPDDPDVRRGLDDLRVFIANQKKAGKEAIEQQRWPDACRCYTILRELAPDDPEVIDGWRKLEAYVSRLRNEGERAFNDSRWADAERAYRELSNCFPNDSTYQDRLDRIRTQIANYGPQLRTRARTAHDARKYRDALKLYRDLRSYYPDDETIPRQVSDLEDRFRQYDELRRDGERARSEQRYRPARQAFQQARELVPEDTDITRIIEELVRLEDSTRPLTGDLLVIILETSSSRPTDQTFVQQMTAFHAAHKARLLDGTIFRANAKTLLPWRPGEAASENLRFDNKDFDKIFAQAFQGVEDLRSRAENKAFKTIFIWETNVNPDFTTRRIEVPKGPPMCLCYWLVDRQNLESESLKTWFTAPRTSWVPNVGQLQRYIDFLAR